jgi:Icc protein
MTRRFAYFTDAHLGQRLAMGGGVDGDRMRYAWEPEAHKSQLRRVLDDIVEKGASDLVFGGDIGARGSVADFFEILGFYGVRPRIVLGNHDDYEAIAPYLRDDARPVHGKACFSLGDLSLKWVFLDSSANRIDEDQLAWLARQLRGVRKLLLFLHHPVLAIETPVEHAGASLREREILKALLTRSGCDISIFCGHYHMDDDRREANIRQFCTPAVSYQIVKKANRLETDTTSCGYRIVEIDGCEIESKVVYLKNFEAVNP